MSDKKSAMELLSETMRRREGKRAELAILVERRRSLNAELFQLEQQIGQMDGQISQDDAAAMRYMKEILSQSS